MNASSDDKITGFTRAVGGVSLPPGYVLDGKDGKLVPWAANIPAESDRQPAGSQRLPGWYDSTAPAASFAQIIWTFVDTTLARELIKLPPLTADRKLDEPRWRGYGRAMAFGRWFPSPATTPIQLSGDGEKRANGLHRLHGIVHAADLNPGFTGIWSPFTYSDEVRGLDVGRPRSVADSVRAGAYSNVGVKSDNEIAALIRWALSIDTGNIKPGKGTYWTHDELLVYLKFYEAELVLAANRGQRHYEAFRRNHQVCVPRSALGLAQFLTRRAAGDSRSDAFFTWLTDGTMTDRRDVKRRFIEFSRTPTWRVQMPDGTVTKAITRDDRLAMILSAWLAFDAGRHESYKGVMKVPDGGWDLGNWPGRGLIRDFTPTLLSVLAA